MKMNRQMREFLSAQKYDEFKAAENKHQFFFDNTIELFDYPKTAKKIAEFLVEDVKKQQQNPSLSAMVVDSQTFKAVNLSFESLEEKQARLAEYTKFIEENINLIIAEAETLRYIENHHDSNVKFPDINHKKYDGIKKETTNNQVQILLPLFLEMPYDIFFKMDDSMTLYPKTMLFFKDYLLADIMQNMRSYKDTIQTFDFVSKKQSTVSFGWYNVRNKFLSEFTKKVEQKYNELTQTKPENQMGGEDE